MPSSRILPIIPRPPETGLYFSVRHNDHVVLSRLLAEKKLNSAGLLFDARNDERHRDLRLQAKQASIAVWLDTQAMELALPSGISDTHRELPWASMPTVPDEFTSITCRAFARQIAEFAVRGEYTGVIAPAHYIHSDESKWLIIDGALTRELRLALNACGGRMIQLIYPLAVHAHALHKPHFCNHIVRRLASLPVAMVTLRIHPFGARSGPQSLRAVVEALRRLRQMYHPFMIERAGFAGNILFALGVVTFVEAGVALGDTFDIGKRIRPEGKPRKHVTRKRIYVEAIGATVDIPVAEKLLGSTRGKSRYACKDTHMCCADGARGMLNDPRRHSVLTRQREFETLSRVPAVHRTKSFVQSVLTPTCDNLFRAADVVGRCHQEHRRMLSIKETVIALSAEQPSAQRRRRVEGVRRRPLAQVIQLPLRDPAGR